MLSQSIDQYSFNKSCQTPLKSVTIYSYKSSWGGRVLQTLRQYLSLHFNGHFPGEPGLAGVYWSKGDGGGGDNSTTGAISRAKLQSNHHHQQTNIQFFTGRMAFLSPNQQCQSTEGKNITFHGLAPSSPGGHPTLSLTTNSSWLPWAYRIKQSQADRSRVKPCSSNKWRVSYETVKQCSPSGAPPSCVGMADV